LRLDFVFFYKKFYKKSGAEQSGAEKWRNGLLSRIKAEHLLNSFSVHPHVEKESFFITHL
jgi:hypothetical protein